MSEDNKKDGFLSDTDDFWSLDSMLPPTEKRCFSPSVKNDVTTVDIDIEGESTAERTEKIPKREDAPEYAPITEKNGARGGSDVFEKWLEGRREAEKNRSTYGKRVVLEYAPGGRYVKKVTVSEETGARAGGERFILDGKRLLGLSAEFSGNVPYESFYPQYSQLSDEQRKCYIAFRTEVKNGRFPEVSRSYIYLYLYELINIAEESPSERAEIMASLINGYKGCDGKLFSDMCRWLSDLCLIHRLKIPSVLYGDVFSRVLECTDSKEVYLDLGYAQTDGRSMLVLSLSRYDYRKSKFYPEFSEYYDRFIPDAVARETERLSKADSRFSDIGRDTFTLTRESYFGAFCISSVRKTVTVEICCISGDEYVRRTVTDTVKYAENRLRSELMIKPRLSVIYLPIAIRDGIKSYFAERRGLFPRRREEKRYEKLSESVPEYEILYEPSEKGISEEAAREIEKSSWDITERLVSAFDGEDEIRSSDRDITCGYVTDNEVLVTDEKADGEKEKTPNINKDIGILCGAYLALVEGDTAGFNKMARDGGFLPAALMDAVNEFFYDDIGDSVLYTDGDDIFAVEDYEEEMTCIINAYRESGDA